MGVYKILKGMKALFRAIIEEKEKSNSCSDCLRQQSLGYTVDGHKVLICTITRKVFYNIEDYYSTCPLKEVPDWDDEVDTGCIRSIIKMLKTHMSMLERNPESVSSILTFDRRKQEIETLENLCKLAGIEL